jgi:hypothetical protein
MHIKVSRLAEGVNNNNNLTKETIMRKLLLFTTFFAFILVSSVWAASGAREGAAPEGMPERAPLQDISGTWTLTFTNGMNYIETFDVAIKQDGESLSIKCSNHPLLGTIEGSGTFKNGRIIEMDLTNHKAVNPDKTTINGVRFILGGKVVSDRMVGFYSIDERNMKMSGPPDPHDEVPDEISDFWTAVRTSSTTIFDYVDKYDLR